MPRAIPLSLAVLSLALAAALHFGLPGRARPAAAPFRHAYSPSGLLRIPAAARGPVSAALARAEGTYQVQGLEAQNAAQKLRTRFSAAAATVASGQGRVKIALSGFGRAGAVRTASTVAPTVRGNRVSYTHGNLQEWFANGPLGLEQGFNVAHRPAGASEPVQFAMSLGGNLHASAGRDGIVFSGHGVSLRYTGLVATDALGHRLGASLHLRGRRLVVSVDDRGARYPIRVDPFVQQAEVSVANEGVNGTVALSGNTLVVGGIDKGTGRPALFVFEKPASGWSSAVAPVATLIAPAGSGVALSAPAISGTTIVAGAYTEEREGHYYEGAAFVWDEPKSGWTSTETPTAELTGSDEGIEEEFGLSVAVAGNTIAVGGHEHKVGTENDQGEAYVFDQPTGGYPMGTKTHETTKIDASDGTGGDYFGFQVAISADGKTLAISAPNHAAPHAPVAGTVYVFQDESEIWTQTAELYTNDTEISSQQGLGSYSLAISESANLIVAGTAGGKGGAAGEIEVWSKPESGWTGAAQTAELSNPPGKPGDLGFSVAISNDTIVAGAIGYALGSAAQGASYVYDEPTSGGWVNATPSEVLTATDGAANDELGDSVATTPGGETIFAGTGRHADSNGGSGAVYVFVPGTGGSGETGGGNSGGTGGSGSSSGTGNSGSSSGTGNTGSNTGSTKPKIPSLASQFGLPSTKACLSKRKLTIHVAEHVLLASSTVKIKGAQVLLAGRVVAKLKASSLIAHVSLVGEKKGSFKITVKVTTTAGKRLSATATFHTCVRSKGKHK